MKMWGGQFAPVKVVNLKRYWVVNLTGVCTLHPHFLHMIPSASRYSLNLSLHEASSGNDSINLIRFMTNIFLEYNYYYSFPTLILF